MTSDLKYLRRHMCVDSFCYLWTDAPFSSHCTKPGYRVSEIIFDPQTWQWDHSSCLALGEKANKHISPSFQTVSLILSNNELCVQLLQVLVEVLCHGMWNGNFGIGNLTNLECKVNKLVWTQSPVLSLTYVATEKDTRKGMCGVCEKSSTISSDGFANLISKTRKRLHMKWILFWLFRRKFSLYSDFVMGIRQYKAEVP